MRNNFFFCVQDLPVFKLESDSIIKHLIEVFETPNIILICETKEESDVITKMMIDKNLNIYWRVIVYQVKDKYNEKLYKKHTPVSVFYFKYSEDELYSIYKEMFKENIYNLKKCTYNFIDVNRKQEKLLQ